MGRKTLNGCGIAEAVWESFREPRLVGWKVGNLHTRRRERALLN